MSRVVSFVSLLLCFFACCDTITKVVQGNTRELFLQHAAVLDSTREMVLHPPSDVLVEGGRIVAVGAQMPPDAQVIGLPGKDLMPGKAQSDYRRRHAATFGDHVHPAYMVVMRGKPFLHLKVKRYAQTDAALED